MINKQNKLREQVASFKIASIIACTFFYFLIFAQFAYLHLLNNFNTPAMYINGSILCMCFGGIIGCLLAAIKHHKPYSTRWIISGFISCSIWPLIAGIQNDFFLFPLIGFGTGLSLGILTVSIASILHISLPHRNLGIWVGIGVGMAYLLCNIPIVIQNSDKMHCVYATSACLLGLLLSNKLNFKVSKAPHPDKKYNSLLQTRKYWIGCLFLMILIWFDSAAFLLIQNTFQQNSITKNPKFVVWAYAILHLLSAVTAGWLLDKRFTFPLLIISLLGLLFGMWGIQNYNHFGWRMLYIISVSFYSTVLVAFVSLFQETPKIFSLKMKIALLFAIGGWLGSTIGILMVYNFPQNLS